MSGELTPHEMYRRLGTRGGFRYPKEYDSRTIKVHNRFTTHVREMMLADAIVGRYLAKSGRKKKRGLILGKM
jgi:hypothetical protein